MAQPQPHFQGLPMGRRPGSDPAQYAGVPFLHMDSSVSHQFGGMQAHSVPHQAPPVPFRQPFQNEVCKQVNSVAFDAYALKYRACAWYCPLLAYVGALKAFWMAQDPNLSMQYPVSAPAIKPARQQEQPVGYSVEVETAVSQDHSTDMNQHDLQGMEQLTVNSWEAHLGALAFT